MKFWLFGSYYREPGSAGDIDLALTGEDFGYGTLCLGDLEALGRSRGLPVDVFLFPDPDGSEQLGLRWEEATGWVLDSRKTLSAGFFEPGRKMPLSDVAGWPGVG